MVLAIGNNSKSGFLHVARQNQVPTAHISTVTHRDDAARDAAMLTALGAAQPDLVVLAGYLKKIGPQVLAAHAGHIINTHPALPPTYGSTGMYGDRVHQAVLADGVTTTGATLHLVTENYDEGPILAQRSVAVLPDDTVESLRQRVQATERALLLEWLTAWSLSSDAPLSPVMPG